MAWKYTDPDYLAQFSGLGRQRAGYLDCVVCHQETAEQDTRECGDCRLMPVCEPCYDNVECCAVACGSCREPMSSCDHKRVPLLRPVP